MTVLPPCINASHWDNRMEWLDRAGQPAELALEGPEDSVFVDDMQELLLGGCQCAAGGGCECELQL